MLGAGIEYYDIALYGYLAPILVQVFLPHLEKTTAYFFYFLFEFFASLGQIAGARYYGKIGDLHGRKKAMYVAMLGTSCVTFIISLLPTYADCGLIATALFCFARVMQSFFLGGEYNGSAIYCLEHETDHKKYGLVSGLYCAFTVTGIILASLVAMMVNILGPEYFRIAYAVSFIFAVSIYCLRKNIKETLLAAQKRNTMSTTFPLKTIILLVVSSLFFGMLYGLPTKIFNAILPIAIGINTNQLMLINTVFLVLYMFLLVIFGIISDKYGVKKVMYSSVILTAIFTYPLFLLIEINALFALCFVKTSFVLLTAAFIGPFHAMVQDLFPAQNRYSNISTYYAIGKCLATIVLASSFLVFKTYNNLQSIALILVFISFITIGVFYEKSK